MESDLLFPIIVSDVALLERRATGRMHTPEIKKSQIDVDMNSNPFQLGAVLCFNATKPVNTSCSTKDEVRSCTEQQVMIHGSIGPSGTVGVRHSEKSIFIPQLRKQFIARKGELL